MDIGERLKILRNESLMTQEQFSKKIGINRATLATYESGHSSIPLKMLMKIADGTACNLNWLVNGIGEKYLLDDAISIGEKITKYVEDRSFYTLPIITDVAAGVPLESSGISLGNFRVPVELIIGNVSNYHLMKVSGDSMFPEIHDSDLILVRRYKDDAWTYAQNKIVVVRLNGEITLKLIKIDMQNQEIHLIPLNNTFKEMIIPAGDGIDIDLIGELKYVFRQY